MNLISGPSEAVISEPIELLNGADTRCGTPGGRASSGRSRRWVGPVQAGLLVIAATFYGLHFLNLGADFPNHSPWMDWSKYTDEGWYGDAAIRHLQRGQWYVPGDFNPAAALPVLPILEFLVFKAAGVSLTSARALTVGVFGGILLTGYFLLRRFTGRDALAPAIAVLLLSVSPFCYVFTRLAILEPLLVLVGLLALLAASSAGFAEARLSNTRAGRWLPAAALGGLIPLMVLTKTTAVFLLPSIVWMVWGSTGYRVWPFLRVTMFSAAIAVGIWGAYFALIVRPNYLADYQYLFNANGYTGMTRENAWSVVVSTVQDGMWIGRAIYPLALAAILVATIGFRRYFRNPVVPSLMLWTAGYAGFLAYHDNLQPRYYLVIAVAMLLLLPVVMEETLHRLTRAAALRFGVFAVVTGMAAVVCVDMWQMVRYVRTPEYGFEEAARELRDVVQADPDHSHLILSISGSDISLITGLPSICDDFGTMTLRERVARYRPGWYATWNEVDDDKMEALAPFFHLERVAAFPAFDDPERNLLILYRLDPPRVEVPRRLGRKTVPRLLRTDTGQQPSEVQLKH